MTQLFVHYLLFAAFAVAMAYAAATDLLTMTISNKLTLGLVAGFLVLSPLAGMDWATFALHWAAGGAVLAVAFFCFAMGWIGGGDAKLAAAVALWLGWGSTIEFIVLASLIGGALTLLLFAFRRSPVLRPRRALSVKRVPARWRNRLLVTISHRRLTISTRLAGDIGRRGWTINRG